MKNGYLNKTEIARVAKMHRELQRLIDSIPQDNPSTTEEATGDCLVGARNLLASLLRWQDRKTLTEIGGK